jgi:transcriptional regulator
VPAVFIDVASMSDRVSIQYHENVVRENLSAWEQAQITMALKDMGMTQPEVATELGLTKHQVSEQQKIAKALAEQDPELLRLLTLPGLEDLVEQGERTDVAETSELISRVLEAVTQEGKDMSRAAWEVANDIDNEIGSVYLEGAVRDAEAVGATFVTEAPTRAERLLFHDIDGELKTFNEFGWDVGDINTHRDTEECHVYFIQEGYQKQKNLTEWCAKPARHKANGKSELKENDATAKQKLLDKDKAERKATKQAKLDRGARAAAALMARQWTPAQVFHELVPTVVHVSADAARVVSQALGLEPIMLKGFDDTMIKDWLATINAWLAEVPETKQVAARLMVVAAETYIDDRTWGDNSEALAAFFTGFETE